MQKLVAVEEAKAVMNQAKDWSVWRWLMEKSKVRKAADTAVDALASLEKQIKNGWDEDLKKAYRELEAQANLETDAKAKRQYEKAKKEANGIDPKIKVAARRVKEADDEAYRARMDAEQAFADAERQMSASMAREGARKAVESWELREKAIRRAESLMSRK